MKDLVRKIGNVDFEITFACNLGCLHCYNKTHKVYNELTTPEILATIDQVHELCFREIHINGGEPLIHPDCVQVLSHCDSLGLETLLETNAVLLTPDKVDLVKELRQVKVRASIDGPEEVHNKIRRTKRDESVYAVATGNLQLAQAQGIPVQITCSVNNLNYDRIEEMVDDLTAKGLTDIRLRLSMPASSGYCHWQILKLDAEKFARVCEQIESIKARYNGSFNGDSITRGKPRLEPKMFITPHGDVKPYPFIEVYAGNVREASLRTILSNYDSVVFPAETEQLMTGYVTELGMGDRDE